ncbi:cyclin-dependent protein kinase complex component [Sporothrix brasiliensis 5110]|uniref:Cyclin-dependent protein kinase complex component n=1 Tax=Sporothrix brasiliensis 5110 TaxID=1398154 RepID=A0A0C2IVZ4_9PEZI|nr:cyclin-dependent protein kinase complex component [Sporothrix brasiliensis 5110]KIH90970.1 cyclin-dependent protein kinase complex component [Sporothrix brasiliensis 5110]
MPTSASTSTTAHHPASPPLSSSNSFSSPHGQAPSGSADVARSAAIVGQNLIRRTSPRKDTSGYARIPTPPDSSSPSSPQQTRNGCVAQPMAANNNETISAAFTSAPAPSSSSSTSGLPSSLPGFPTSYVLPVPPLPPTGPQQRPQRTILIRDLNHIQSLTQADGALGDGAGLGGPLGAGLGGGSLGLGGTAPLQDVKFEISAMPIGDVIEMVAALLTKITTTNDHQHDALHRNAAQQRQAQVHNDGGADGTSNGHSSGGHSASPFSASVLAFHGKNVPAITILSYLSRIHKYCPTTYEVFLSLLVYFDRMTERVNALVMKQQQQQEKQRDLQKERTERNDRVAGDKDVAMHDADAGSSDVDETDEGLADSSDSSSSSEDEDDEGGVPRRDTAAATAAAAATASSKTTPAPSAPLDVAGSLSAATYFVVDSFNIHRLIIAGVTCASKFFSDVFYTNARYAKVGGLPLAELNHLELQFLILNDFRLAIPIEDLEAYATMLVEFYAREVVGTRPRSSSATAGGVPTTQPVGGAAMAAAP